MLFICHSTTDEQAAIDVKRRALERGYSDRQIFLDSDPESGISAGADWQYLIYDRLKACQALIVVCSPRFGESKWCFAELVAAKILGKHVFPVVIEECTIDAILEERQAVFPYLEGDAAFERLWKSLEENGLGPGDTQQLPPHSVQPTWVPFVPDPLQHAPHFAGRSGILAELRNWITDADHPTKVFALVAPGGTGKTALAERVLDSLKSHFLAGIFVWNFRDNPKTEAFLRAACEYFFNETPNETGGLLERLQRGLRADGRPHLLILDGLELVQATGATGRQRGELEDPIMNRLLRWLAAAFDTRAKALITSRFPLPDLEGYSGRGFRDEHLTDLEPAAALSVLRGWGVQGSDVRLRRILKRLQTPPAQSVHALSVALLGSYLAKQWSGDSSKLPKFDATIDATDDGAEARLTCILSKFAETLPDPERDLMVRVSMLRRGATLECLETLIESGGDVAGSLIGCNQLRLRQLLDGLRDLGLVFRSTTMQGLKFSVHPLVGTWFQKLEGVPDSTLIHRALWRKAAPTHLTIVDGDYGAIQLIDRCRQPGKYPDSLKKLDHFEQQIELSRATGRNDKSLHLYNETLGRLYLLAASYYAHGFDRRFGDDAREFRILSAFIGNIRPSEVEIGRYNSDLAEMAYFWGKAATYLGDLTAARRAFEILFRTSQVYDEDGVYHVLDHRPGVEARAGRWKALETIATDGGGGSYLALAAFKLGQHTNLERVNDDHCKIFCRCTLPSKSNRVQDRVSLMIDRAEACRSGEVEKLICCHHIAAEIERDENNFSVAITEAIDGIHLADSCGFGAWSLDIRTELATIHLAAGNPKAAIEPAEWVLKRSQEKDCRYAWGVADSLHQLGVAYSRLGDVSKARDYLRQAIAKRQRLKHHALIETKAELARLSMG